MQSCKEMYMPIRINKYYVSLGVVKKNLIVNSLSEGLSFCRGNDEVIEL